MSTATASRPFQGNFDGSMSGGETQFCLDVRDLIHGALEGRITFVGVIAGLRGDLLELKKHGYDVDSAVASGVRFGVADPHHRSSPAGRFSLTDSERAFLNDTDGFLDYSLRNGLLFRAPLQVLAHDVGEIAQHGFSLEDTLREVRPKATGWAKTNAESVGEAEEPLG